MESWRNELYHSLVARTRWTDELYHYGVLGMRWGVRRYQPYAVRPRKSGKTGKELGIASRLKYKKHTIHSIYYTRKNTKNDREVNKERVGLVANQINMRMVKSINGSNHTDYGGEYNNCINCSTAYLLNSLFNVSCTAKPVSKKEAERGGVTLDPALNLFDGVEEIDFIRKRTEKQPDLYDGLSHIKDGSTGMILFQWKDFDDSDWCGHAIVYERKKGSSVDDIVLIDPQTGEMFTGENLKRYSKPTDYYSKIGAIEDFSNAKLMGNVFIDNIDLGSKTIEHYVTLK